MQPWILRAIPAFLVPLLLVAAMAACGPARQSAPSNQAGERPQEPARAASSSQVSLAQPARIALAQEEEAPAAETEPEADMPAAEEPTAEPAAQDEQPVSEAPAPVATAEPAPLVAAPTDTAPMAGAATPTIDLSRVLEEPAIQTAVAQFSNMAPPLPPIPNQNGQQQGAPAAAQTQAAIMMATLTAR